VKEVQSLCSELTFPSWIDGQKIPMQVIAYEVLRVLWSHPFHRMVWDIIHVTEIQDFNSEKTRTYAHFYHLLARLLLSPEAPPEDIEDVFKHLANYIDVLPANWARAIPNPIQCQELTWDDLRDAIKCCDKDEAGVAAQRKAQATTEFGSEKKRAVLYSSGRDKGSGGKKRKRGSAVEGTPSKKPRVRGKNKALSEQVAVDSDSNTSSNSSPLSDIDKWTDKEAGTDDDEAGEDI